MSRIKRMNQQGLQYDYGMINDLYEDIARRDERLESVLDSSDFSRVFRGLSHSFTRIASKERPFTVIKRGAQKSNTLIRK